MVRAVNFQYSDAPESQCRSACNFKIQALNLVNFRLRFADNLKIQVLNTGISVRILGAIFGIQN